MISQPQDFSDVRNFRDRQLWRIGPSGCVLLNSVDTQTPVLSLETPLLEQTLWELQLREGVRGPTVGPS